MGQNADQLFLDNKMRPLECLLLSTTDHNSPQSDGFVEKEFRLPSPHTSGRLCSSSCPGGAEAGSAVHFFTRKVTAVREQILLIPQTLGLLQTFTLLTEHKHSGEVLQSLPAEASEHVHADRCDSDIWKDSCCSLVDFCSTFARTNATDKRRTPSWFAIHLKEFH